MSVSRHQDEGGVSIVCGSGQEEGRLGKGSHKTLIRNKTNMSMFKIRFLCSANTSICLSCCLTDKSHFLIITRYAAAYYKSGVFISHFHELPSV